MEAQYVQFSGEYPAGSPSKWVTKRLNNLLGAVDTPCAGCNACCRSGYDVRVHPEIDSVDKLKTTGGILQKKPDGSCAHLIDGQCNVYDHRPNECQVYDCRLMLWAGSIAQDSPVGKALAKQWHIVTQTPEDKKTMMALSFGVMEAAELGIEAAEERAEYALIRFPKNRPIVQDIWDMVATMPAHEREKHADAFLKRVEA